MFIQIAETAEGRVGSDLCRPDQFIKRMDGRIPAQPAKYLFKAYSIRRQAFNCDRFGEWLDMTGFPIG